MAYPTKLQISREYKVLCRFRAPKDLLKKKNEQLYKKTNLYYGGWFFQYMRAQQAVNC